MTETLSIRIEAETKKGLDLLARRSRRSVSFLAAEAIFAYVAFEQWQLGEIQAGIVDVDARRSVSHDKVENRLDSWSKRG